MKMGISGVELGRSLGTVTFGVIVLAEVGHVPFVSSCKEHLKLVYRSQHSGGGGRRI